jgi:hypothetical protein
VKPLLIVLALVGVLFLVILFASGANRAQKAPPDDEGRRQTARTAPRPALVTVAGAVLGRWGRKVEFAQTAYTVAGNEVPVTVPRSDDSFRRATIRVAPPNCASVKIVYDATEGEGADLKLDHQEWQGTDDDPCVGSIVVRPKGGMLKMTCAQGQTCSITFE